MTVGSTNVSWRIPAGALAAAALFGACAAPVAVTPAEPADPDCAAVVAALPERISGQEQRTTDPPSDSTAAWGDPPIVVRCGGSPPAALAPDSPLTSINGVDWFAEELTGGFRFTSVGASPQLEVTVPRAYSPEASVLLQVQGAATSPTPPG